MVEEGPLFFSRMIWLLTIAVLAFLYPYVVFPVLLALVTGARRRFRSCGDDELPRVAVLVSAFNEASHILDKLRNFAAFDYPADKVRMWIGTDGSEDGTAAIIRQAGAPRVNLVERLSRSGKTAVLNDLASRARSEAEIFVFTDV